MSMLIGYEIKHAKIPGQQGGLLWVRYRQPCLDCLLGNFVLSEIGENRLDDVLLLVALLEVEQWLDLLIDDQKEMALEALSA